MAGIPALPRGLRPRDEKPVPFLPQVISLQKIQECADGGDTGSRHLVKGGNVPGGHLRIGDVLRLQVPADEKCRIEPLVAQEIPPQPFFSGCIII